MPTPPRPFCRRLTRRGKLLPLMGLVLLALGLAVAGGVLAYHSWATQPAEQAAPEPQAGQEIPVAARAAQPYPMAPELEGGTAWLNTAGPLRLKDLRGKVVVLDFWTLCCINCIHTLPDLAKLEKKYANELVVIGVHSPKFDNEKDTESIRKAILRYEVSHPVVNDANRAIWDAFGAEAWPSLYLIDPEGRLVARGSGEGLYEPLDNAISDLIKVHKQKKTLNEKPLKFELARFQESGASPLFFPGKVLADAKSDRLFIADSTHHRVVITTLAGKKVAVAGMGEPGYKDGTFAAAQFDDPQGMALVGNTLYVADRKNHLIRALDLEKQTVSTAAGTGTQARERDAGGPAREVGLNSPWALLAMGDTLYVAMAGHHQIWTLDLKKNELQPYAGDGFENILDGTKPRSRFAQPSGLATDGKNLYVADSEVSAVRMIDLAPDGQVTTLVGRGLFVFGDVDGTGDDARLQHALGTVFHDGVLYVADTYNSKIKVIDPGKKTVKTFLGGEAEGWLAGPLFSEPGGLSAANGKLYVADTNAHRIRVVDLKTRAVSTLPLEGVEAPAPGKK